MWMWSTGINRNIVECKDGYFVFNEKTGMVLIETLWNVKTTVLNRHSPDSIVLIETLWNVKLYNSRKGIWSNVVLIETLWNVKQIASSVHP